MGSWNETCFVSQMPVCYGDDVRIFLVAQMSNSWGDEPMKGNYTDDFMKPFVYPLRGQYEDYGNVSVLSGVERPLETVVVDQVNDMLRTLHRRKTFQDQGAHQFDDVNELLDNLDLVRSEEFYKPCPVAMLLCHEDMYQAVKELPGKFSGPKKSNYWWRKYDEKTVRADLTEFLEALRTEAKSDFFNINCIHLGIGLMSMPKEGERLRENVFNDIYRTMSRSESVILGPHLVRAVEVLKENPDAPIDEIMHPMIQERAVEFFLFKMGLDMLRKQWCPQSGAGSQGEEYGVHVHLARAIGRTARAKIAKDKAALEAYRDEQ